MGKLFSSISTVRKYSPHYRWVTTPEIVENVLQRSERATLPLILTTRRIILESKCWLIVLRKQVFSTIITTRRDKIWKTYQLSPKKPNVKTIPQPLKQMLRALLREVTLNVINSSHGVQLRNAQHQAKPRWYKMTELSPRGGTRYVTLVWSIPAFLTPMCRPHMCMIGLCAGYREHWHFVWELLPPFQIPDNIVRV